MRHNILFARQGEDGLEESVILHLGTEAPSATNHEEAFNRFRAAVAEWLKDTPDGQLAWIESGYNFNIGDFGSLGSCVRPCRSLLECLDRQGIVLFSLQPVNFDYQVPYDRVLGDDWDIHKKGDDDAPGS